jgi:hypothetical protein
MRASEIAHTIALKMLHAAALGCHSMVEDILNKTEGEKFDEARCGTLTGDLDEYREGGGRTDRGRADIHR